MDKTDAALSKILNSLADKFGTTIDHLYAIMIKQAYITGCECLIGIIPISLIIYLYIRLFNKNRGTESVNEFAAENFGWILIGIFVIGGGLMGIAVLIINAANALLNPEYYALTHIINN